MQTKPFSVAAGIRRLMLFGCVAGVGMATLVSPAAADVAGAAEITQKYEQAGGASSPLGSPSSDVHEVAGGAGRDYQGGAIYYSKPTGAHVMYGVILDEYGRLGGPGSDLGFPTNDESDTSGAGGRFNDFAAPEGAAMFWTPQQGAWVVRGPILAAYRKLGGPTGELGFPAAASVNSDGTVTQKFSGDNGNAQLSWSSEGGFTTVPGSLAAALSGLRIPGMGGALPEGSIELPDGKFQLPDGSIKLPDGTFQLPNGNIVLADGSIKLPDGSITLPEGAIRLPDGSLQYANGLVRMPDGSFKLPEGAIQLPDGTIKMPDGSIVFPSGGVKLPNGSFEFPGMAMPEGSMKLPDGSIKLPDGSFQLPNGNIVLPDGSIKLPDGSITLPDGAVRLSDGALQYANGLVRLPDGSFKLPEGAIGLPDGSVKMPDGSIVFPSGGVKLPNGSFEFPGMSAPSVEKSTGWFDRYKDRLGGWWWWLLPLLVVLALIGLISWLWGKRGGGAGGGTGGRGPSGGIDVNKAGAAGTAGAAGLGSRARGTAGEAAEDVAGFGKRAGEKIGDAAEGVVGTGKHAGAKIGDAAEGAVGFGKRAGAKIGDTAEDLVGFGKHAGESAGGAGKHAGMAAAGAAAAGAAAMTGSRKGMTGASTATSTEINALFDGMDGTDAVNTTYGAAAPGLSATVVGAKLLVDENMSPRIVEILDAAGYDAVHARDLGLQGGANRATLDRAKSLGRTLVTCERSYAADMVGNPSAPSVIILQNAEAKVDDHVALLGQALPLLDQVLATGALAVVSDQGVRARQLPLRRR